MSELAENFAGALDLDRITAHQIHSKKDFYGGTQTRRRDQPAGATLSRTCETMAPLTRAKSSGFEATSATPDGTNLVPATPRQTLPEHFVTEMEQKPFVPEMEQKPSLLRQHVAEITKLPDKKEVSLPSAVSQLRESVTCAAHPLPPAINFEAAQAPPTRPTRLAPRDQTHAARNAIDISIASPNPGQQQAGAGAGAGAVAGDGDGAGAGRSTRGEAALQIEAHANAGPDEKRDASVSIRCLPRLDALPARSWLCFGVK